MEDFGGHALPHRPLGLRVHRRRPGRPASPSSPTRSSALVGTGATGIQCLPPSPRRPSTSTSSSARRRRSACGATARPTPSSPSSSTGVAAGPDGQLPGGDVRASRSTKTWSTTAGPSTTPRSTTRPGAGHDARGVHRSAARSSTSRSWRSTGARSTRWSTTRRRRGAEAVLPLPVQAALLPRRVPRRVQRAERHAGRLPCGLRPGDRARARSSTARSTRSTASSTAPASRPSSRRSRGGPATTSSAGAASRWPRSGRTGSSTLFGMMTRGFPNLFIMPAPGQQAVVTVNYTQLAVLGAEFIAATVGLLEERGVEGVRRERRGRGGAGRQHRRLFVDASPVMSACTPSRINNEGTRRRSTRATATTAAASATSSATGTCWSAGSSRATSRVWSCVDGPDRRPRGRRRHRRRGRDRRRDRRGARPPGAFVVTVDPLVTLDGAEQLPGARGDDRRAHRRRRRLGAGLVGRRSPTLRRCATCSTELVDEHGAPRRGDQRRRHHPTHGFASGTEEDWRGVLAVHLDGYLNVLARRAADHGGGRPRPHPRRHLGLGLASRRRRRLQLRQAGGRRAHVAARPGRAARGRGQRHVADRRHPHGHRRARPGAAPAVAAGERGRATGGLSLGSMPEPESSDRSARTWPARISRGARGQVIFAGGAEVAVIDEPRLLEVVRTDGVASLAARARGGRCRRLAPAEAEQVSGGGSNPRFGAAFDDARRRPARRRRRRRARS